MRLLILFALWTLSKASYAVEPDPQKAIAENKAQAIVQAQKQVAGRVLKVDQYKTLFRVKMLQQSGRVVTIEIRRRVGIAATPPTTPTNNKEQ